MPFDGNALITKETLLPDLVYQNLDGMFESSTYISNEGHHLELFIG